jgi:diguanylate cyclase (GGDEF)-like protein/PAS domain S-box-containing protein
MSVPGSVQAASADGFQPKAMLALQAAALESMPQGVCIVDADQRVVLFNQRYITMFGLSPDVVRVGTPFIDLMRHSAECGNLPAASIEETYRKRMALIERGEPFRLIRQLANGLTFAVNYRPLGDGYWMALIEDVTERQAKEFMQLTQFERFDQAINHMSHGLCAVDANHCLVLYNQLFLDMYDLSSDFIRPGLSMRDIIEHAGERGFFQNATPERVWQRRLEKMAAREPFQQRQHLQNGRHYILHYHPMADGGWVTLCEDVTERQRMEEALRVQFERFDHAINHMSHGLCVFGPDERLIVCNARYTDIYGLDPAIVKPGITHRDLLTHWTSCGNEPGLSAEEFYQRRKVATDGKAVSTMLLHLKDGRMVELKSRPTPDGGWVSAHEDVTEQLHYEKVLREQNVLFDAALENMAHGLCVFDKDWRVVVRNQLYLDIYGYTDEQVRPGTPVIDLVRDALAQGVHISDHSAEEFVEDFKRRVTIDHEPVIYRRLSNGRMIAVRHRPLKDGGWVGTFEDVTERERAAEELQEQYRRFDAALENMAHGLAMFDADNRLIVCNDKYVSVFKADPRVVKPGITLREIFEHGVGTGLYPGQSADDLLVRRLAVVARRETVAYDQKMADGRTIEVKTCPTANGGWVGTFDDITERRRVEAEHAVVTAEIHRQNILLDASLENMAHGLCVFDKDWRIIVRNRRYLELYGLGPNDAPPGTALVDLIRHSLDNGFYATKASAEEFFADFQRRIEAGEPVLHRRLASGRLIAVRHQPLENGGWVGTYEDITERERAADELKEQHRLFNTALENMAHGLCMFDADMRLIVCNPRYIEMFGMSPDVVHPGTTIRAVLEHSIALGNYRHDAATAATLYEKYVESLKSGNLILHRHLADGRIVKLTHEPMPQGGFVAIYEDITERHRAEEHIAHMARHDSLTQLPNRVLLRERMAEGLARVDSHGEPMAVFYLDLDNFKGVNDTLGHPIGDKLLGIIAARIRGAVREGDTVARLGGDEFAVLQGHSSPEVAGALARRLVSVISDPIEIDGQEINSGVSIGIALAPNDGTAADHLMKCADLALYRAKAEGRGTFRFFEPDMDACIQARRALELDLRRALTAGEFSLVYQPQINLASNELVAMEALLRWNNAERGPVPPSEFIPLAEEMGLIVPLGEWVLREACHEAARWPDPVKVAVNLSPVQFRNRALVTTVTQALAAARLAPHRLELEITEAVLLQDDEAIVTMLHQLRALGVRISMDDFGTGYSSLSYLRSFPFDKIKIDRSFIKDIDRNRDSAVIIRAIASLGTSLGIETTAEGIETEEQLDVVRRAGCTEMQGYLASPPRPASEALGLIARFRREVVAA